MKLIIFIALALQAISLCSLGQSDYTFFHPLSLNAENSAFFQNPTSIPIQKVYVSLDYQGRIGLFKNVNTVWGIAGYSFGDSLSSKSDIFSLGIVNEKENGYINRSRLLFSYTRKQPLTDRTFIKAGIALGFYSFTIKSSNTSPGASVFLPDGSLGVDLQSTNHELGFGVAQIFNNEFVLLEVPNLLKRYFQLHYRYQLELSPFTTWKLAGYYFPLRDSQIFQAETSFQLDQYGYAGLNYTDITGLSASAGINLARSEHWKYNLGFTWRILGSDVPVQSGKYEIRLLVR